MTGAKHVTRQYGSDDALKSKWTTEAYARRGAMPRETSSTRVEAAHLGF